MQFSREESEQSARAVLIPPVTFIRELYSTAGKEREKENDTERESV